MSIKVGDSVDVSTDATEVTQVSSETTVTSNVHEPCVQEKDPAIDVVKSEYSIVGDALFATVSGDVPYWLSVLIDNAVDNSIASGLSDYNDLRQDVANAIASIDAASNTYVEQITLDQTIDDAISARLTTLDATYQNQFATKVELTTAVANREAAVAQDISDLSVSFNDTLDTRITNVETAFAAADSTLADSINALESSFSDQNSDVTANATAVDGLRTYVGVDATNTPDGTGLTSRVDTHSEAFTNLENAITGPAGDTAYALSNLEQRSATYSDEAATGVESKFAYESILNINGQYYKAGFGLTASGLTQTAAGTEQDPFDSRFWVNADQFIISDSLGATAPVFSVDTTSRDVIFNGKVTFNSGGSQRTGTIDEAITASVEQVAVGDKNINITDNLIPMTSLISDSNNAGYQFVGDPVKAAAVGIDTFAEPQITLDANDEVYSPYVDELQYAYYFRIGIKGITSLSPIKITTLDAGDVATYGTLVHQMLAGETLSATEWYVIDGIINPTGGSNDFAGAIRKPDGTKIGDIRNFVLPADAERLVLGFQYNVVVSRVKLSKITADTITSSVATTDYVNTYVDGELADFDLSYDNLTGKDQMAQQFGYADYAGLEAAYAGGSTIINGGSLNTGLIAAEAITADMVVSSGLITNTAQIDDGLITTAKIADTIESTSWNAETNAGWQINKAGTAIFNETQVRGKVFAEELYSDSLFIGDKYNNPVKTSATDRVDFGDGQTKTLLTNTITLPAAAKVAVNWSLYAYSRQNKNHWTVRVRIKRTIGETTTTLYEDITPVSKFASDPNTTWDLNQVEVVGYHPSANSTSAPFNASPLEYTQTVNVGSDGYGGAAHSGTFVNDSNKFLVPLSVLLGHHKISTHIGNDTVSTGISLIDDNVPAGAVTYAIELYVYDLSTTSYISAKDRSIELSYVLL